MKKLITAILFFTVSLSAFSATTGTTLLRTFIPVKVSIILAPVSVASALDLSTTQKNLKVASITASSNSTTGFKITFTSANLGKLKRVSGAEIFPYTMKLSGSNVGLGTTSGKTFNFNQSAPRTILRDITISYTGKAAQTMISGTYMDTVTVTIAAR